MIMRQGEKDDAGHQGVDEWTVVRDPVNLNDTPLAEPPWPTIANTCWNGSAGQVTEFLKGDIDLDISGSVFYLPRQTALLWERRMDVRRRFNLNTIESLHRFVSWLLTQGMVENSVDPSLLSERFSRQITQLSSLSKSFSDVPISLLMLITKDVARGRDFLEPGRRWFPMKRVGRLAQGLWGTFVAPKLYGWPAEWTTAARGYFDALSSVSIDGLSLTRAAIAVWEVRPALQRAFSLRDETSRWAYLCWLVLEGLPRLGVDIDEFDERLRFFLAQRSPRASDMARVVEMVHTLRPDFRKDFDVREPTQRIALHNWLDHHIFEFYPHLAPSLTSRHPRKVERVTVALSGFWSSPSGRGEDLRCSVEALKAAGFSDYCVVDLGSEKLFRPDGTEINTELRARFNICHVNADTALVDWLKLRSLGVTADHTIGYWAWELEWLPSYWRHAFSFYDEIWAATRFAEAAFRRENLRTVKLVPMAVVAPPEIVDFDRARVGVAPSATLFIFIFNFRSYTVRKNPEAVIQAFVRAFPKGDENAVLLLKTTDAAVKLSDWQRIKAACRLDKRISLIDGTFTRADVCGLIASANAFVSLHRSEGFGRLPAEAMLLNVPVILTNYSGTTDFAHESCALPVGYSLIPVQPTDYPGAEGQCWAEPDTWQAAEHMRWVYANPRKAKGLARKGRNEIQRLYNARTVGRRMLDVLGLGIQRD